jgi:Arc/MetJ-type ribon-helix-helix transcriptional regulator
MPSSYNIPELDKKKIDALVKSGFYSSKSDVVKDALRYMFEHKKPLGIAAAVELYRHGEVSLGKAAEIAGIGIIEFKESLASHGYKRILAVTKKDIKKADKLLEKLK